MLKVAITSGILLMSTILISQNENRGRGVHAQMVQSNEEQAKALEALVELEKLVNENKNLTKGDINVINDRLYTDLSSYDSPQEPSRTP